MENHLKESSVVADLSIKSAVKAGFSFVKHIDNDMFNMLGVYFILSCLYGLLEAFVFSHNASSVSQVIHVVISSIIGLPLAIYMVQKVVLGKEAGAYLGYYMDSTAWRLLAANFLVFLIMFAPLALMLFGTFTISTGGGALGFLLVGVGFVLLFVCVYYVIRLSFITTHVAIHNNIDLSYAFNLSKGIVLKILGIAFLSVVPIFIAVAIFSYFGLVDKQMATNMAVQMPGAEQVSGQVLADGIYQGMNLGGSLVSGLVHGLTTTVYAYLGFIPGAAAAHLYKEVIKSKG